MRTMEIELATDLLIDLFLSSVLQISLPSISDDTTPIPQNIILPP